MPDTGKMQQVKEVDGVQVLKVSGSFTMGTTPDFQKTCQTVASDKTVKAVLLDFSEVTRIDTAAFACMINFIKDHMNENFGIGIINLKVQEKGLMDILRIEKIIRVFNSETEAINFLKG